MTNTTTNTKVLNVKNIIVANTLMEKLIDFIRENKDDFTGDIYKNKHCYVMEDRAACLQARSIWTTIALLTDIYPDTFSGDWKMAELWESCGLEGQIDSNDFDLFMWGELC